MKYTESLKSCDLRYRLFSGVQMPQIKKVRRLTPIKILPVGSYFRLNLFSVEGDIFLV